MFPAIIYLSLATLGLTGVHGLALDRLPSASARSGPDLLIRFPFALERNHSLARHSPFVHSDYNATFTISSDHNSKFKRSPTPTDNAPNDAPTPAPTGDPSNLTTVHISDEQDFALLLPKTPNGSFFVLEFMSKQFRLLSLPLCILSDIFYFLLELISDAESDGVSYCSKPGCENTFPDGFITGSVVQKADDGSWIQVSCLFWFWSLIISLVARLCLLLR